MHINSILVWYILPAFIFSTFDFSSYAGPLLSYGFVFMLISIFHGNKLYVSKVFYFLLFFSIFSIFTSFAFFGQPLGLKQIFTLPLLFFLGIVASTLFKGFFERSHFKYIKDLKKSCVIITLIGFISIFYPIPILAYSNLTKPVFPFPEPSHFALAFGQITAMSFPFLNKNQKLLLAFIAFILGGLFPNLTLMAISLLLIALLVNLHMLLIILLLLTAFVPLFLESDIGVILYILNRISFGDNANLSSLVYQQGWESIFSAFKSTYSFGIGFQNLGNEPPTPASIVINELTNDANLNRSDGGFLLAKFCGEFGFVGIFISLFYFYYIFKSFTILRAINKLQISTDRAFILVPVMLMYISVVEFLIRGIGYFSPFFLITLATAPSAIKTIRIFSINKKIPL